MNDSRKQLPSSKQHGGAPSNPAAGVVVSGLSSQNKQKPSLKNAVASLNVSQKQQLAVISANADVGSVGISSK
jgi:hypothetical protein